MINGIALRSSPVDQSELMEKPWNVKTGVLRTSELSTADNSPATSTADSSPATNMSMAEGNAQNDKLVLTFGRFSLLSEEFYASSIGSESVGGERKSYDFDIEYEEDEKHAQMFTFGDHHVNADDDTEEDVMTNTNENTMLSNTVVLLVYSTASMYFIISALFSFYALNVPSLASLTAFQAWNCALAVIGMPLLVMNRNAPFTYLRKHTLLLASSLLVYTIYAAYCASVAGVRYWDESVLNFLILVLYSQVAFGYLYCATRLEKAMQANVEDNFVSDKV